MIALDQPPSISERPDESCVNKLIFVQPETRRFVSILSLFGTLLLKLKEICLNFLVWHFLGVLVFQMREFSETNVTLQNFLAGGEIISPTAGQSFLDNLSSSL